MASENERRPFLLRLEPATMAALKAWAADDLRSLNGQVEYLLRSALRDANRLPDKTRKDRADGDIGPDRSEPPGARNTQRQRSPAEREPTTSGRSAR